MEESHGEMLTAIGEPAPSLIRQAPEVAGATNAIVTISTLHKAVLLKTAEMAPHHLHRNLQLAGQDAGGGMAGIQQQSEHRLPGGCIGFDRDHSERGHKT